MESLLPLMEMEEGSEYFLGLGQKAELFGGDSEFILGKQYRKPETVLCSISGAGMVGAQSSAH